MPFGKYFHASLMHLILIRRCLLLFKMCRLTVCPFTVYFNSVNCKIICSFHSEYNHCGTSTFEMADVLGSFWLDYPILYCLTHWGLDKMAAISQTTILNAFFWMKMNIPALVPIMAWRRSGNKPLSEPMIVRLPTHICVTRPQWVNYVISLSSSRIFRWILFSYYFKWKIFKKWDALAQLCRSQDCVFPNSRYIHFLNLSFCVFSGNPLQIEELVAKLENEKQERARENSETGMLGNIYIYIYIPWNL